MYMSATWDVVFSQIIGPKIAESLKSSRMPLFFLGVMVRIHRGGLSSLSRGLIAELIYEELK